MPGITIESKLDTKSVISGFSDIQRAVQSLKGAISRTGRDLDASVVGYAKAMENNAAATRNFNNQISSLKNAADTLRYQLTSLASVRVPNPEFKQLEDEIKAVSKEYERLDKADSKFINNGVGILIKHWDSFQKKIEANREAAERFAATLAAMKSELAGINNTINTGKKSDGTVLSPDELKAAKKRRAQLMNDIWMGETLPPQEYQTYENAQKNIARMIANGDDKIIEEYRRNSEELKKASDHRRELLSKRDQMQKSGQDTVSGATTQEYKDAEEKFKQVNQQIENVKKQGETALKPQFLKEWESMPTVTHAVEEGFSRIKNAAQIAGQAITHPFQALDRIIPVIASGLANLAHNAINAVIAGLQRLASTVINAVVAGLQRLASTAINAAMGLARMVGGAVVSGLKRLASAAVNVASSLARMAGGAVLSFMQRLANAARNASVHLGNMVRNGLNGLGRLASVAARAASSLLGIGKNARRSNSSLKQSLKMVLRYVLGVRSMYMLVRRLRSAVADAFKNMAKKVPEVNKALSALASSFNRMKNSLATAFQPIVSAVAPYLTKLMDMVSDAMTKVGMFFATLTGQGYVYKATKAQIDYAESLDKTKKKAKEAENQLAGFDHLNILKDTDNDKEETPTSDFEKVPIESGISALAKKLKDLFTNGEFMEIGSLLAEMLTDWINKIDFGKVGDKIAEIINDIVDLVNGFFDNFDFIDLGEKLSEAFMHMVENIHWYELGRAFTQKFKAAIELLFGFLSDIDWDLIGDAIANFLQGAFDNIPWELLGTTFGMLITGVFQAIYTAAESFDWNDAGERIKTSLKNMVKGIDIKVVSAAFRTVIKGLLKVITPALKDKEIWKKISSDFAGFLKDFFGDAEMWANASEAVEDAIDDILIVVSGIFGDEELWKSIGKDAADFFNKILGNEKMWEEIGETVNGFMNGVLTFGEEFLTTFNATAAGTNIVNALKEINWDGIATRTWELLKLALSKAGSFVDALFSEPLDVTRAQIAPAYAEKVMAFNNQNIGTRIAIRLKQALSMIPWKEIAEYVWDKAGEAFKTAGDFVTTLLNVTKEDIANQGGDKTKAIGFKIGDLLTDGIADINWEDFSEKISTMVTGLFSAIDGFFQAIGTDVITIDGKQTTKLQNSLERFFGSINWNGIATSVWDAAKTAFSTIGDFLSALLNITDDDLASADGSATKAAGHKIGQMLADAISTIDWEEFGGTISTMVTGLFDTINGFFQEIGTKEINIGGKNVSKLQYAIISFFDSIKWNDIATSVWDAAKTAFATAGDIVLALLNVTEEDIANQEGDKFKAVGYKIGSMLADGIAKIDWADFATTLSDTAKGLFDSINTFFQAFASADSDSAIFTDDGRKISALQNALEQFFSHIDWVGIAKSLIGAAQTAFVDTGVQIGGSLIVGIDKGIKQATFGDNTELADMLQPGVSPKQIDDRDTRNAVLRARSAYESIKTQLAEEAKQLGYDTVDGYINGVEGKKQEVTNAVREAYIGTYEENVSGKKGFDTGSPSKVTEELGKNVADGFINGLGDEKTNSTDALTGTLLDPFEDDVEGKTGFDVGQTKAERTYALGKTIADSFAKALEFVKVSVGTRVFTVFDYFRQQITDTIGNNNWSSVGSNITSGILSGITSGWTWLYNTVWALAVSLLNAAKAALGIASPSKLFRDEVGYMVGAGLAEGIDDSQNEVLGSLTDMATAMVDEMQNTDLTADINTNEDTMLNSLRTVLTSFTENVEDSFTRLTDRLQAIADKVTFITPDIAAGTVLPYAIQGDINVNTSDISVALDKNNEELISVIIQAVNNQTSAIVQALAQYSNGDGKPDMKAITNYAIEEINRRTRAMGKSPLLI